MGTVSLLTDFGLEDAYVSVVKGVMLTINPAVTIVDVSHGVAPGDLSRAAYLVEAAYAYFPSDSVHVVVVDPGVGSDRRIVALQLDGHRFLAPDNGVLTRVLEKCAPERAVSVENGRYFLSPVSRTFHGRDIFAPVAAHLDMGLDMGALGPAIEPGKLVRLPLPRPVFTDGEGVSGTVDAVDRFGNLITNIRRRDLVSGERQVEPGQWAVHIAGRWVDEISVTYTAVVPGGLLALFGSTDCLEISVNGGSAMKMLGVGPGEHVRVRPGPRDRGVD